MPEPRVVGLVDERQVDLGQVDQLDVEAAVRAAALDEPVGDRLADATGTGAGEDDVELGHGLWPTPHLAR